MLLEPGMPVHGQDGELGTVDEVVADENADIFRGFTLSVGLFSANVLVPQDKIVAVTKDGVTVSLTRDEVERLRPVLPPTNS